MALYRVLLQGQHVQLLFEEEIAPIEHGFYKTAYVWAWTEAMAVDKARLQVHTLLHLKADGIVLSSLPALVLSVAEIERTWALWCWFKQEAFVFYRAERQSI